MATATTPFYVDWTFWAFAASAIAILFSQLPPVKFWFRRGKLALELSEKIWLSHMAGFTNLQAYINIRNIGGRSVRVTKISMDLVRHNKHLVETKVHTYIANEENASNRVAFTPFHLQVEHEWGFRVNAFQGLVAKEDRALYKLRRALRLNIGDKLDKAKQKDGDSAATVVADNNVLQPLLALFNKNFVLEAGEYEMKTTVHTVPIASTLTVEHRFTLYDEDSSELKSYADDYKFGLGAGVDYENHEGVISQLYPK